MTVSFATFPTYAKPGAEVRVTPSAATGYVRLWITDAPAGSEWKAKLDATTATRLLVHEGDAGRAFTFAGDKPGAYVFSADEITRADASGNGGHDQATASLPTETLVGTNAVTLYVGQRLTASIGTPADGRAELVLWVWNDTIRATTLELHGEVTPSLTPLGATPTARMRAAVLSSSVQTAMAALADVAVATALGNLSTIVANIRTRYEAHRVNTTYHYATDSANEVLPEYAELGGTYSTAEGLANAARSTRAAFARHYTNDAGAGIGGETYHQDGSSNNLADWANLPLDAPGAADRIGQMMAVADLWASYEAHRADTSIHKVADTTALAPLPALLSLLRYFSAALRNPNPTAPAVENPGALLLVSAAGMKEG